MKILSGSQQVFVPVCHELFLGVALQGVVSEESRRTDRGAEDEGAGRTDRDQPEPSSGVATSKDEQAARSAIENEPGGEVGNRNPPPGDLDAPAQHTYGERELQDVRVSQVDGMTECLCDLLLDRRDLEARNGRHEMRPRRTACHGLLGKAGIGDHRDVRVFLEMLGQVRKRGPAFHLCWHPVDHEVQAGRVARLGEADIVTVSDQLVHDKSLGRISPQRPSRA